MTPAAPNVSTTNLPRTVLNGQGLMGGRNVRKKDDSSEELDETWLEEDQDVWAPLGRGSTE